MAVVSQKLVGGVRLEYLHKFHIRRYAKEPTHGTDVMRVLRICCALDPRHRKKVFPSICQDLITEAVALGECIIVVLWRLAP